MKLYELSKRNIKVRLVGDLKNPPDDYGCKVGDVITFHKLDGMYSLCSDVQGNYTHPAAWTEVEVVE